MGQAAQKVEDAATVINGLENQVDTHLANLLSGWQGAASRRFETLLRTWLLDFQDIRKQLQIMSEKLGATGQSYAATEQNEEQAINQLSALLNRR